jgi:hypothetical protein
MCRKPHDLSALTTKGERSGKWQQAARQPRGQAKADKKLRR